MLHNIPPAGGDTWLCQQGHGHLHLQGAPGGVCGGHSFQLPCHDPPLGTLTGYSFYWIGWGGGGGGFGPFACHMFLHGSSLSCIDLRTTHKNKGHFLKDYQQSRVALFGMM